MLTTLKTMIHGALGEIGYTILNTDVLARLKSGASNDIDHLKAQITRITQELHEARTAVIYHDNQIMMAEQHVRAVLKDMEPEFSSFYDFCRPFSGGSAERLHNLHLAVRYIVSAGIEGAFIECGVWKGGTMMMVAATLRAMGVTNRKLYLYDTFAGHPKPNADLDIDLWGNRAIDDWQHYQRGDEKTSDWANASLEEVKANMALTGYPMDNIVFVKSMVEDTLPTNVPDKISLLRIDVDWHEPARVIMQHLYPLLQTDGMLIIDDYGHYDRIDYTCRTAIKPRQGAVRPWSIAIAPCPTTPDK